MISQPINESILAEGSFINRNEALNYLDVSTYYLRKLIKGNRLTTYIYIEQKNMKISIFLNFKIL